MKCTNCGNDLMVGQVHKGLAKILNFLPLSTYTCVRCGKSSLRLGVRSSVVFVCLLVGIGAVLYEHVWPTQCYTVRRSVNHETITRAQEAAAPPASEPTQAKAAPVQEPLTTTTGQDSAGSAKSTAQDSEPPTKDPDPQGTGLLALFQEQPLEEVYVNAPSAPKPPVGSGPLAQVPTAELTDVSATAKGDTVNVHLRVKGTFGSPHGFGLDSPPRFVLDIPGHWSFAGATLLQVNKGNIQAVRVGVHDKSLRIVLDLTQTGLQPRIRTSAKSLTLTVP